MAVTGGRCMQSLCLQVAQRLARRETVNKQSLSRWQEGSARCRERLWEACLSSNDLILTGGSFGIRGGHSAAFKGKLFHWSRILKYILASQNVRLHFCSWCTGQVVCLSTMSALAPSRIVLPVPPAQPSGFPVVVSWRAPSFLSLIPPYPSFPASLHCFTVVSSSLLPLWCFATVCIPHSDLSSLGTFFFFFFGYHSLLYPQCPAYSKC